MSFEYISKKEYRDFRLHLEVYQLFTAAQAQEWFTYLDQHIDWRQALLKKDGTPTDRRASQLFGDDGVVYTTGYQGLVQHRPVEPWGRVPRMQELKSIASGISGEHFSVNIAQRYHTGRTGIEPHRDKEMVPGTIIAGQSFGATRWLQMSLCAQWADLPTDKSASDGWSQEECSCRFFHGGNEPHRKRFLTIPLPPGSMYIFRPPTNDTWLHCILKDDTCRRPRISLTWRNYRSSTSSSTSEPSKRKRGEDPVPELATKRARCAPITQFFSRRAQLNKGGPSERVCEANNERAD